MNLLEFFTFLKRCKFYFIATYKDATPNDNE